MNLRNYRKLEYFSNLLNLEIHVIHTLLIIFYVDSLLLFILTVHLNHDLKVWFNLELKSRLIEGK